MKGIKILVISLLAGGVLYGQQNPIGNPPSPSTVNNNANSAWYRGGNNIGGTTPVGANIFGTRWNSPIYTITNNINRSRLNGSLTALINGVNRNVDGFFGLAPGGFFATNTPAAMLHLYGPNNTTFGIGGGWRPWMSTGMLVNENSDAIYVGMKPEPLTNRSDAIICWNDDGSPNQPFSDKLRFIFSGASVNGNGNGLNPIDPRNLNGYEYMRMTSSPTQMNSTGAPVGNIGIGPVFSDANAPQNRLHMNAEENLAVFMQISNQAGTGQGAFDGFIAGYPATTANNVEAVINQRENDRLSLYTNNGERMRITHIGALNAAIPFNPGALTSNLTRVAISHNPNSPITRPLSLLHLGYNTQNATNNDGWRPWMDVGMFVSNQSDNVYLGLKQEPGAVFGGDRQDAVLSWGDNQASGFPPGNGPDNFRFIFTSTTAATSPGSSPANTTNGLEGARMTPTLTTGVFTGFGGAPTVNPYGPGGTSLNPTATLEVNSWGVTTIPGGSSGLRFTNLNTSSPVISPNPGPGVLSVNASGDVIYVPGGAGATMGNICPSAVTNPLTNNWEIPLGGFNYVFTGQGISNYNVGIGTTCTPVAKLDVMQSSGNNGSTAVKVGNTDVLGIGVDVTANGPFAVKGLALMEDPGTLTTTGVYGEASYNSTKASIGVRGNANSSASTNYAGYFQSVSSVNNPNENYGVDCRGSNAVYNYGGRFTGRGFAGSTIANYGVYGVALGTAGINTAIYGEVFDPSDYAGYFQGTVFISGGSTGTGAALVSDQMFKTDVDVIKSGTEILRQLKPHTYKMKTTDYPQFNFDDEKQYGFIAQEVETVLPELVNNSHSIAVRDSLGNVIHPAVSFKALNYNALIPITVQAINEITTQIDRSTLSDQSIKTNVQNLTGSLNKIKLMRGVKHEWSTQAQTSMGLDSLQHIGFIAQEINAIEPLLTFVDDSSLMHVNYDRLVPVLVESIKELDTQLQQKDSALNAMQAQINQILSNMESCCNNNHSMLQNETNAIGMNVELKDGQSIVLEQNVPNPFAEQTTINYFLPDDVSKAQILFYNAQGKLIQSTELTQKGKGQLNVFASDLSNGIYTYTLVVDGKIIETKKMVKQQ